MKAADKDTGRENIENAPNFLGISELSMQLKMYSNRAKGKILSKRSVLRTILYACVTILIFTRITFFLSVLPKNKLHSNRGSLRYTHIRSHYCGLTVPYFRKVLVYFIQ